MSCVARTRTCYRTGQAVRTCGRGRRRIFSVRGESKGSADGLGGGGGGLDHEGVVRGSARDLAVTVLTPPWARFNRGSMLSIEVGGELAEKGTGGFGGKAPVTLPSLTQALDMAAVDPRINGVFLNIKPIGCGWAKLEELRRALQKLRSAGKFTLCYAEIASMKEYYIMSACEERYAPPGAYFSLRGVAVSGTFLRGVLDKIGIEPQVQRIGKYKSAGDQLARRDMSDAQREALSAILDDVYSNFVTTVASDLGKAEADVEAFLDKAEFDIGEFIADGYLTGQKYYDELKKAIAPRTGGAKGVLRTVGLKKYRKTPPMLLGMGGKDVVGILRASGAISRGGGGGLGGGGGGIKSDNFLKEIRKLRKMKNIKAVVLRIDSPGGDALASDLMWREIQLLSREKPVIASMSDVAASGGYYMSMACSKIVAESLTLTGSIGVVTGKVNLGELYDKVGFGKEVISRGKFAELDTDERSFTAEEEAYFARSAKHAYESFRNKAAESRAMSVEAMEDVAQGRVWTGVRAAKVGLVDEIGGMKTAIEVAMKEAGIEKAPTLLEVTKPVRPGIGALLSMGAMTLENVFSALELIKEVKEGAKNSSVDNKFFLMDDLEL